MKTPSMPLPKGSGPLLRKVAEMIVLQAALLALML